MNVKIIIAMMAVFLMLTGCQSSKRTAAQDDPPIFKSNDDYDLARAASINTQLGLAYLKQGDVERAKSKLLIALTQNKRDPLVQSAMGYFYEKTGDIKQARQYYSKSISLAPKKGASQNNYGAFLCRQGEYRESISHFLIAVKDENYLQTAEAYENAGFCALDIPDKVAARDYFKKATLNDPKLYRAYLELAELEFELGHYPVSKHYLEQFSKHHGQTARSLLLGIYIAEKTGDKNSAASYALLLKAKYKNSVQYQQYHETKGA